MSVKTMRPRLSEEDILRLMKGSSAEDRAQATHKLCRRIGNDELTQEDKVIASEILGLLSRDAEALVRRAMSITLKNSPNLPRDVAVKLAQDIESVALPVIENSPVFTSSDLVELVLNASETKQSAVARRSKLGTDVTDAIAEHGCKDAVCTMAANDGATMSEKGYDFTLKRFETDHDVHEALISREWIPPQIAEKMISLVSGEMFDQLVNNHELPPQLAIELASGARERASLDLVAQAGHSSNLPRFVQQLNLNNRLTPSMIMRALCLGHMSFVEWSLAELSGIPHQKMWLLLHDAGSLGLKKVFEYAGLPKGMYMPFQMAISVYHELDYDGREGDRDRFKKRMVERVLTQFQNIPKGDLDYLLDRLDAYRDVENGKIGAAA
ncbi:MAG: hypothetical protein CMK09_07655 [Ponticaulis sp.]|nr:hypothetical protein [Ponticaulis sp.]|tara:strand:- start:62429 stop:63577 length:1149 start_codon:yes stop_codon:yes gene_type:complete